MISLLEQQDFLPQFSASDEPSFENAINCALQTVTKKIGWVFASVQPFRPIPKHPDQFITFSAVIASRHDSRSQLLNTHPLFGFACMYLYVVGHVRHFFFIHSSHSASAGTNPICVVHSNVVNGVTVAVGCRLSVPHRIELKSLQPYCTIHRVQSVSIPSAHIGITPISLLYSMCICLLLVYLCIAPHARQAYNGGYIRG